MGDLLILSYLFIQLFVSVCTQGYVYYTLGYNPILLYFVAQIVLALAIGTPMSFSHTAIIVCFILFGLAWF